MFAQSQAAPRDDRADRAAQGPARAEDRRGQQRRRASSTRTGFARSGSDALVGCFRVLVLRAHPQARRRHVSARAGHRSGTRRARRSTSRTPRCSSTIAEGLGIRSILHTDYRSTRRKLASLGLGTTKEASVKPRLVQRILTINGGSSSIKFAAVRVPAASAATDRATAEIERIGLSGGHASA